MSFLHELFSSITHRNVLSRRRPVERVKPDHARVIQACNDLLASDGEASSIALASRALGLYGRLPVEEKLQFFECLARDFAADPAGIDQAYQAYRESRDNSKLERLFQVCEPRRQELFRRLNLATGGTHDLVRMREDLLGVLRDRPDLRPIDSDFAHLFASWFNRGFLVLRRIDWHTPAAILEKIIRYEAVHEIHDWDDLRRRLDATDRRCFAFFHPAIGDEPLIFVEVALHKGLPDKVQPILKSTSHDVEEPEAADTAAFFGISNCQMGLRGISFGNFLIKQVVQELKQELPSLRNFVTLSPVPGFGRWLEQQREQEAWAPEVREALSLLDAPGWARNPEKAERLQDVVLPLAGHYLLKTKNDRDQPLNAVARFHLGNGARLHRINWLGDDSDKGVSQAAGLMVNYLYVLDEIERNHEQYTARGAIACSSDVRDLARQAKKMINKEPAR